MGVGELSAGVGIVRKSNLFRPWPDIPESWGKNVGVHRCGSGHGNLYDRGSGLELADHSVTRTNCPLERSKFLIRNGQKKTNNIFAI